ncbi:hypothetical protein BBAD15_g10152 [Beauveria bassiana D1-5]|uniref:Uncharacterized protein n=1 Tax=Beauveria bassiana D1-5 TaxID=1245745 RepID=A0A0A2VEQ5_BEABA|nr:hypothetical protein BBAD15_g10152 [Beauveria bassiana D1-5]
MASTNRPLDESTATLVAPDDHFQVKDLLSTPTNASTAISSGTVSDEEPSTPEPLADVPVSVLCGWPHTGGPDGKPGREVTKESGWPHEDDPKDPAAKKPKGRPPGGTTPDDGSGWWPHPGDSDKPDPAKWHTLKSTTNDGTTDATSKDDSVSVLCGWPHAGGPNGKTGGQVTKDSGWPHVDDPKHPAAKSPEGLTSLGSSDKPDPGDSSKDDPAKGWPKGNSDKPDPAKLHTLNDTSNDGADSTSSQDGSSASVLRAAAAKNPSVPDNASDLVPTPGDSSKPDPANGWPNGNASKPDPAKRGRQGQRGNGAAGETDDDTDAPFKNESGWPHFDGPTKDWAAAAKNLGVPDNGSDLVPTPGDSSKPDPAKILPDDGGNDGNDQTQPETAGPKRRKSGTFGPEGQPPWGVKNLAATTAAAANATSLEGPEGQPPWGVKNLGAAVNAKAVAGPEGQPPWGTIKGRGKGGEDGEQKNASSA